MHDTETMYGSSHLEQDGKEGEIKEGGVFSKDARSGRVIYPLGGPAQPA